MLPTSFGQTDSTIWIWCTRNTHSGQQSRYVVQRTTTIWKSPTFALRWHVTKIHSLLFTSYAFSSMCCLIDCSRLFCGLQRVWMHVEGCSAMVTAIPWPASTTSQCSITAWERYHSHHYSQFYLEFYFLTFSDLTCFLSHTHFCFLNFLHYLLS